MNKETLQKRVEKAFNNKRTQEYAKDYISSIRNLVHDADDRQRNSTLFFILSIIAFDFFLKQLSLKYHWDRSKSTI